MEKPTAERDYYCQVFSMDLGDLEPGDYRIINLLKSYGDIVRSEEREKLLLTDKPWSILEILKKLNEAAKILLHKKDYDGHGWEEIEICTKKADEYLKQQ